MNKILMDVEVSAAAIVPELNLILERINGTMGSFGFRGGELSFRSVIGTISVSSASMIPLSDARELARRLADDFRDHFPAWGVSIVNIRRAK